MIWNWKVKLGAIVDDLDWPSVMNIYYHDNTVCVQTFIFFCAGTLKNNIISF